MFSLFFLQPVIWEDSLLCNIKIAKPMYLEFTLSVFLFSIIGVIFQAIVFMGLSLDLFQIAGLFLPFSVSLSLRFISASCFLM